MEEKPVLNQICPSCGAQLPQEASFCPYCAQSINQRVELEPPAHRWRKALRVGGVLLVLACLALGCVWALGPRVYDGQGQVVYTDSDGTYQLVLAYPENRYEPVPAVYHNAEEGEEYRFPVRLYINHVDSGADAGQLFLQKVDRVEAELLPPPEGSGTVSCTQPAPDSYMPEAAMVSYVDYVAQQDFTAQMVWTVHMSDGDAIRLRQDLSVTLIQTYDYYPEDAPMDTIEELQALIDEVSAAVEPDAVVNFHLPAVTYQGGLVIESRPVNLYGTQEGERRTTFTGPIRMDADSNRWICYVRQIDFRGAGDGVAISTSARVWAEDCTFTGWKTGLLGYGTAWVNAIGCLFEDNEVGFRFNSTGDQASHSMYNDNVFRNNGTAVLLENVPTDLTLNFDNSLFVGNGTDIDNQCGQPLNIEHAIFQ